MRDMNGPVYDSGLCPTGHINIKINGIIFIGRNIKLYSDLRNEIACPFIWGRGGGNLKT